MNIYLFLFFHLHITLKSLENEVYRMSCSPRPYISQVRPFQSIFHLPTLISLLGQALIHIIILSNGATIFSSLSEKTMSREQKSLSIRFPLRNFAFSSCGDSANPVHRFTPRERFRPNLLTNYVFILSIAQNTMITLTNHLGKPYQEDILENRSVIVLTFLSQLLCVILVTEQFPSLNRFLELAPFTNKKIRIVMISLLALNSLTSLTLRFIARTLPQRRAYHLREEIRSSRHRNAADLEVQTLARYRDENFQLISVFICLLIVVILKGIIL